MKHRWYLGMAFTLVPMMFGPAGRSKAGTRLPGGPATGKPAGPGTPEAIHADFDRGVANSNGGGSNAWPGWRPARGRTRPERPTRRIPAVIANGLYREANRRPSA